MFHDATFTDRSEMLLERTHLSLSRKAGVAEPGLLTLCKAKRLLGAHLGLRVVAAAHFKMWELVRGANRLLELWPLNPGDGAALRDTRTANFRSFWGQPSHYSLRK